MKYFPKILIGFFLSVIVISHCQANPISALYSFFQRDLTIDVLFKNHKNLLQGSPVYIAASPNAQKIQIGKVNQITLVPSELPKVEIIINKKYKNKIYETAQFVLMSGNFANNTDGYILVVVPPHTAETKLLKSGAVVNGISFFEYHISNAGKELKNLMGSISKQNRALLKEIEQYIENSDTEFLLEKLDNIANQIVQFTNEQKTAFEQDVLPALKKAFNKILKQLENQSNEEELKEIEKRLNEIETLIET